MLDQIAQLVDRAAARLGEPGAELVGDLASSTPAAALALVGKCRKKVARATSAASQIASIVTASKPRAANSSIAAEKISWRVRSFLRARRVGSGVGATMAVAYSITGLEVHHGSESGLREDLR